MLIRYHYYKLLLIFNISLSSIEFETSMGPCEIDDPLNNIALIEYVQNTTNNLIHEFGSINKRMPFYIKIINDNNLWQKKFPNLDWAIGIAIKNKIFINREKISNNKKLLETISHEICHVYQHKIKNGNTFPSWFKEGMAMHFSKEFSFDKNNTIAKSIWLNCLIELNDLNNISHLDKNQINIAYQESRLAYESIIRQFGVESINGILQKMKDDNVSFDLAFRSNTNTNLIDFETQFDLELITSDDKYIIFRQPMNWFFLSAIILIIIYIVVRFRNKKIIEKWDIEEEIEKLNEDIANNSDD